MKSNMQSNEDSHAVDFKINEPLPLQNRSCNHQVQLAIRQRDEVEDDMEKRLPNTNLTE